MALSDLERKTLIENIEECVFDKDEIVTFDWFSEAFSVHVNAAKSLLDEFCNKQKGSGINRTLCFGGTENGELKIFVTSEDQAKTLAPQLDLKLFEHIYSIQKNPLTCGKNIYTAEHAKFKENVKASGRHSSITYNCGDVQKTEGKTQVNGNTNNVPEKIAKEAVAKAFMEKPKTIEKPAEVKKEPVKEVKTTSAKTGNAKTISNMFARQQSRPKVETKKEPEVKPEAELKAPDVAMEEGSDDDEFQKKTKRGKAEKTKEVAKKRAAEEKDSGKAKKSKVQPKKTRRIQQISDSSDSESEEEELDRAPSPILEQPAPELDSEEEPEAKAPSPAVVAETTTRKRTMKQVTKQYMDEEGFLITKKEFEACSESEDEEKPIPPKKDETVPIQVPAKAKEPAKRPASPAKKKQSTISSFFTRKQ